MYPGISYSQIIVRGAGVRIGSALFLCSEQIAAIISTLFNFRSFGGYLYHNKMFRLEVSNNVSDNSCEPERVLGSLKISFLKPHLVATRWGNSLHQSHCH
jgi:hypothetical protein